MSPSPCLATITDVSRSGTEVPAARNVRPMTASGMPKMQPIIVAHQTIRKEKMPTHAMLPKKATYLYFSSPCFRTSGMVKTSAKLSGTRIT